MRPLLLLLSVLLVLAARAQAPRAEPRKTDPFDRTVERINALLAQRLSPPAFEPARFNPFIIGPRPGTVPVQTDGGAGPEVFPPSSDETVLQQLASTIRVTGFFSRDDRNYVVVDGAPRREGDFIILRHRDTPVNLRLKSVENHRLVLGLNDAEYVLRF